MSLTALSRWGTKVSALSPLQGMPLTSLGLSWSFKVSDLSPLQGMPLTYLNCCGTNVTDLTPLKGMSLTYFEGDVTKISDLIAVGRDEADDIALFRYACNGPVARCGMPLTLFCCQGSKVSDISPLQGTNLKEVGFTPQNITKGLEIIRQMTSVDVIVYAFPKFLNFSPTRSGRNMTPVSLVNLFPSSSTTLLSNHG